MALVQVALLQLLFKSKLTRLWLLVLLVLPVRTLATPVVPQFRSGSSTMSSTSQSVINETITSHQYNSGFSYSASGHNIESADLMVISTLQRLLEQLKLLMVFSLAGQVQRLKMCLDGK